MQNKRLTIGVGWFLFLFDPYLHINSWSKKLLFSFLKIVAMVDNAMLSDT